MWFFKAIDPKTREKKSIIFMVTYDEVVDGNYQESTYISLPDFGLPEEITAHFERIHRWSGYDYSEMVRLSGFARIWVDSVHQIMFDDSAWNNSVRVKLG